MTSQAKCAFHFSTGSGTLPTQNESPKEQNTTNQKVLKVIDSPVAPYPEEARKKGIEGMVTLSIVVDAKGNVSQVKVLSGPQELTPAAIASVKMWRYEPPSSAPATKTVVISCGSPECPGSISDRSAVEGSGRLFDKDGKLVAVVDQDDYLLPPYPEKERKAGAVGTMVLSVTLNSDGHVKEIHAIKSLSPDRQNCHRDGPSVEIQAVRRKSQCRSGRFADPVCVPRNLQPRFWTELRCMMGTTPQEQERLPRIVIRGLCAILITVSLGQGYVHGQRVGPLFQYVVTAAGEPRGSRSIYTVRPGSRQTLYFSNDKLTIAASIEVEDIRDGVTRLKVRAKSYPGTVGRETSERELKSALQREYTYVPFERLSMPVDGGGVLSLEGAIADKMGNLSEPLASHPVETEPGEIF